MSPVTVKALRLVEGCDDPLEEQGHDAFQLGVGGL